MKTKVIIISILLIISQTIYAHSDMIFSKSIGNFHFEYLSGWREFEIDNKIDILLHLTEKLIKTKKYQNIPFYIYFNHDYTKSDTTYKTLGFGEFNFQVKWNKRQKSRKKGIILIIRDRDFDIEKLLNLISNSFENQNYIKENEKQIIIDLKSVVNGIRQYDTLSTIDVATIREYELKKDEIVEQLTKEKTYRYLEPKEQEGIDYYYQDNQFCIYIVDKSEEISKEKVLLKVENIHEIFGHSNRNFVFVNDSVFHFLDGYKQKIRGEFTIQNLRNGRPPIFNYYSEYKPINKYYLIFDNYGEFDKALYLPDSNIIISDYDQLEDKIIEETIRNKNQNIEQEKNDKGGKFITIILIIGLIISIIANVWLYNSKADKIQ